jgi:hypothetical protein
MRRYYLNFTNHRFNKCQETWEREKKHTFDCIMYMHNTAIHNRVFKTYETINQGKTKLSTNRISKEIYKYHDIEH